MISLQGQPMDDWVHLIGAKSCASDFLPFSLHLTSNDRGLQCYEDIDAKLWVCTHQ